MVERMSWENTLKTDRKRKRMSKFAQEYMDELMSDGKRRTMNEILDELMKKTEKQNRLVGSNIIPTRGELRYYLRQYKSQPRGGKQKVTEWWKE
mgnify:CR=1 FL=1